MQLTEINGSRTTAVYVDPMDIERVEAITWKSKDLWGCWPNSRVYLRGLKHPYCVLERAESISRARAAALRPRGVE
jgi:hypothetical protein